MKSKYRQFVNGWEWNLDSDNLIYWKDYSDYRSVIGIVWLDTVEGDNGWNKDGDCWLVTMINDSYGKECNVQDSIDCWDNYCREISEVMRRKEAEEWLYNYMETH